MYLKTSHVFLVLLLTLSFINNKATAQGTSSSESQFPQIFTPQAQTLGSVVLTPISTYTGKPSINIPIYTINHYGLQVPISLTYDASAFVPSKIPGLVGLNWALGAGGLITRTVNTTPDDKYRDDDTPISGLNGFLVAHPYNLYTNSTVEVMGGNMLDPSTGYYSLPYELSPDLFTFNFGGHSGKFMMGMDGQIHVQSDEHIKVDLQLDNVDKIISTLYAGKITITTDDGVKYEFGGTYASVEFSYTQTGSDYGTQVINAWYLTKITSPEGNVINFIYANKGVAYIS